MRFESNAESQFDKLPSFRAFCKNNKMGTTERRYVVCTIWLPNQYNSISLDTEYFRLRISDSQAYFEELLTALSEAESNESALCIDILDAKTARFSIELMEGETASWEQLGEYGRRLKIEKRASKSTKRKQQNS